jgi:hypothetical protein
MADDDGATVGGTRSDPQADAVRKRRLDEVFGDVLPDTTSDEREDPDGGEASERWLREQVPPHHG